MKQHLFQKFKQKFNQNFKPVFKRYIRLSFLSVFSGVLSGLAAAAFLIMLEWATRTRDMHPKIIWALPVAGFAIGWIYHRYGNQVNHGSNLILDEIHDPKKVLPARMAPFILFGTVLTHLFGGSAGREGTAVQMGASLSDQLSNFFHITPEERKILLVAGAGVGFGAAIGAPWAGAIFGMEVIAIGRIRLFAWFECLIASFVGYYVTILAGAHHSIFPTFNIPGFDLKNAAFVAFAGILFGLSVIVFIRMTHFIERVLKKFIPYAPLRPLIAGLLLVFLYHLEGSYRYVGLGISEIQEAILGQSQFSVPAFKAFFTALTVGSGFKGGEFIPLVFVGATLGSALSIIIPVSFQLLATVGFASVFAGAANTPIACSLMAIEIFGYQIAPYAVIACFMSYYSSGHRGIYKSQKINNHKHARIRSILSWFKESWHKGRQK